MAIPLSMVSALGNQALGRLVREKPAAIPLSRVSALGNHAIGRIARSVLARDGDGGADAGAATLDPYGGTLPPGGLPDSALPDGGMAPPVTAQQTPQQTPAAPVGQSAQPIPATPAPPDRDTLVRDAINEVLRGYQNLAVLIPVNMPPTPGRRPATRPAAGATPGTTDAGAGGDAVAAGPPAQVTFGSPYFINRSSGDGGAAGGQHGLGAPGVRAWFDALPNAVKVGKGASAQLQTAMQQAVDQGLLNGTWPPTSQTLVAFMREVGLGVDCSGFVYLALMAADAALSGAGMAGLTSPQTSSIGNSGSQSIGRSGGTRVTRPGDLRIGDIIQMAPNAGHAVGHIRILTSVRPSTDWVEYDTAESTTRVGSGPQGSTWRIPAGGPMDTAHLEVRDNSTGAWSAETTGRPSTYWRRLTATPPAAAPAPTGAAPAARAIARRPIAAPATGPSISDRTVARAPPRAGGWNEADREVTGTWRIPITGLTQGLAGADANAATAEEAQHRAVAVVPKSITPENLEVLLHFHGNNLGERERTGPSESGMAKGTVRDVEGDLIPQQLAASGRNIIGILPQGTVAGGKLGVKFGVTDPKAYVTDVLTQVVTHVNQLDATKNLQGLSPVRIDVSGHSGGGPAAVEAASGLQANKDSKDQDWVAAPPLLLFDAINGIDELKLLTGLVEGWLKEDKRRLLDNKTEAEATALLSRRGLKLRSTYTGGVYHATNSKREPRTYQYPPHPEVTIPANLSLEAKLDAWFASNNSALGSLATILRGQYVVEHVGGSHDFTVGAGNLQTGPRAAVPGVTQAPGAPAGSAEAPTNASGNLARGLGMLSPADRAAAPAAPPAASAPPPQAAPASSPGGSNGGAPRSDDLDAGVPDGPSLPGGLARSIARSVTAREKWILARQSQPPTAAPAVSGAARRTRRSVPRIARQPRPGAPSAGNDDIARQFGAADWQTFKAERQQANDTVFGQPVQGLLPVFLGKLRGAENAVAASQNGGRPITAQDWRTRFGVTSVGGLRFNASGGPASTHGWGLAIDVNYSGAPFVMHEAREQVLDAQLAPVYHRIAWLILYRESAIPQAITQVGRSEDTRAWYRTLRAESDAMRRYFQMMHDPNDINWNTVYEDVTYEIWGHLGVGAMPNPGTPAQAQVAVRELLRAQMARDYAILGAQGGVDVGGGLTTPNVPGVKRSDDSAADRPFAARDPGQGFMDLNEEVVVALRAQSGVRWGAIDFGGESGDVMHFDLRDHLESKRAAAVAALRAAQADGGAPAADGGTVARSLWPPADPGEDGTAGA